jgi:putative zinc finger protein
VNRHVDGLLPAYINRELSLDESAHVYRHLLACQRCRVALTTHQNLASDVRDTLTLSSNPRAIELQVWWRQIRVASRPVSARRQVPIMARVMLSLVVVALPMMATLSTYLARSTPALARSAPGDALSTFEPENVISLASPVPSYWALAPQTALLTTETPVQGATHAGMQLTPGEQTTVAP